MPRKGLSGLAILLIIVAAVIGIASVVGIVYWMSTMGAAPAAEIEYDGEFDDAYLATKAWFYSDFSEGTDCNITNDVLGMSTYGTCIYETNSRIYGNASGITNSSDFQIDLVLDLSDDVEEIDFDCELQNTGTGQAKDDIVIKEASLWTYEDDPEKITDLEIEDQVEIDDVYGPLEGDEYVLHIVFHTKTIDPQFADGDDIMRCAIDLTTDGDVDKARITMESG
ncbi:MAG: hypothetical protein ACTSW1_00675 [Candidatus Hodarchaeales archaeon]